METTIVDGRELSADSLHPDYYILKERSPATWDTLQRYLRDRVPTGNFLEALLSNDLKETFRHADDVNVQLIHRWVKYLYNHAPYAAWGSPEAYREWLNG